MKLRRGAIPFLAVATVVSPALAAEPGQSTPVQEAPVTTARRITLPRVVRPPVIEDYLRGTPAAAGIRVSDFRQQQPGDGTPATLETSAYLSYDYQNIYVVFVCKDDPGKVRARLSKREDISDDDRVTIYFDSFSDHRHAYYFSVNPLGVQADGIVTAGQDPDSRFDTYWRSEGRLTPEGYVVWMAIPFKSLRFSSAQEQIWGVALGRALVRNNENSYWPYITHRTKNFVEQFAALDGLEAISAGRNIQMIPYGAFTHGKTLDTGAGRYRSQNDGRVGLDTKLVLHDSLSLDVTLNPDFSQVESDDPQVTINQRYEVQFPEKRPFFLENSGYFDTPINLFFTRRIVDPEYGARLTGKVGRWAIGVLGIDDRAPGKVVNSANSLYEDRAKIGVARIQREFGKDSKIGILASDREFGSSYNRMVSIDTELRLSPTWYFTGQMAQSRDRAYDSNFQLVKSTGPAYWAALTRSGRHFTYSGNYLDFSPDFRAPLGFIKRVDIRQIGQYAAYYFRPESGKVLAWGPSASYGVDWDRRGTLQDWYANPTLSVDLKGPAGFKLSRYDAYEKYLDQGFRYHQYSGFFYANWIKSIIFYGSYAQGTGVNYSPAFGLDPFLAGLKTASLGVTVRPKPRLRIEEYYFFSWLGSRQVDRGAGSVFNNHLSRTKLNYQFTRALSLRGILDYYALLPNTGLINSDRYKQLSGDVLLTYMLHPGTALYLGYNNRRENFVLDPDHPPSLRRDGSPSYLTGSQVFVKLSYLLRF